MLDRDPLMGLRAFGWGVAAAACYCAAALLVFPGRPAPGRLVYDGLAPPPPYRWVHPPPELAKDNQPPDTGTGVVTFDPSGSRPQVVPTGDGQAAITFERNVFAYRQREPSVRVMIAPQDPGTIGPPPPGLRFDGNAYRVAAVYLSSGKPATLHGPATILLLYATGATRMLQSAGTGWTPLPTQVFHAALEIAATPTALGAFVAAAPVDLPYVRTTPWWSYALSAAITGAPLLVIFLVARWLRRRK